MTTTQLSVADAIAEAIRLRNEGMARAEEADRSGWNSNLIDRAIEVYADQGVPFSANDIRAELPDDVPGPLMGARFSAAATRGRIRFVGFVASTKPNTHCKRVGQWVGATDEGAPTS